MENHAPQFGELSDTLDEDMVQRIDWTNQENQQRFGIAKDGKRWSFFNKKLKRIVYLSCVARSRLQCPSPFSDVEDAYRIPRGDSYDDFPAGELLLDDD